MIAWLFLNVGKYAVVKVVMWSGGGGLTWRSQVGANPTPIPHPTNLALLGHKITLYRFKPHTIAGGSNRNRGLSPPGPITLTTENLAVQDASDDGRWQLTWLWSVSALGRLTCFVADRAVTFDVFVAMLSSCELRKYWRITNIHEAKLSLDLSIDMLCNVMQWNVIMFQHCTTYGSCRCLWRPKVSK